MKLDKNKALVLFSGGQDSTTCLVWALKKYQKVTAINIFYGQRHLVEIEQAEKIANILDINYISMDVSNVFDMGVSNAMMNKELEIKTDETIPNTFVPGRNLLFINIAMMYAYKNGIQNIVGGMCEADFSGYPDCRSEFISSAERTINLATNCDFNIITPLMNLTKAKIWLLAKELGILEIIINLTHTCYYGDRNELHEWGYGCGECPACTLRKNGFIKAFT